MKVTVLFEPARPTAARPWEGPRRVSAVRTEQRDEAAGSGRFGSKEGPAGVRPRRTLASRFQFLKLPVAARRGTGRQLEHASSGTLGHCYIALFWLYTTLAI